MTREQLVSAAIIKYGFRRQRAGEKDGPYLAELIRFVQHRDFAAGHELRVGRQQSEWSRTDTEMFLGVLRNGVTGPSPTFKPGIHVIDIIEHDGPFECTDASLVELADSVLHIVCERRRNYPYEDLQPVVSALLSNGTLLHATPTSDDRLAVLKEMVARKAFGFFLVFDTWVHRVDLISGSASKSDAITAHIGSRKIGIIKVRQYRVVEGKTIFDEPLPDMKKGDPEWKGWAYDNVL